MEGYDAKFEPSLEKRLECPICLLAQREPMQTPCGHRFCSACILRALSETGPRCPVDNTRVASHQLFKDNFAKREVLSLHVRCHADDQGCKWHGELRNLDDHTRMCELVSISCPNECGHRCLRKHLPNHLPSCTNKPTPCSFCSIFLPRNKTAEHASYCSKIKLPESVLSNILKCNEVLKWCGHLRMKVQGQSYAVDGYLTVKEDSEERFIQTASWSTSINLIPLTGQAAKIFLKTLEGPEVRPVTLHFSLLSNDSRATNFHKIIKKKYHAAVGLRLKSSSRRELMILYLYWNESRKRMMACVAELKNYLVREMQSRLQQLKRTTQQLERNVNASSAGPSNRPNGPQARHDRGSHSNYQPVRVINVPTNAAPSASTESQPPPQHPAPPPPASHVLPSILSWQLSPSFPAYPWRVQTAGPSVPFFTIPSTPPQFLPAHSYPYTFAPMPAIGPPPFSINPFQPVPAVTVPSYAGVTVPQVTGLNGEVIMSSTIHPSHQLSDVPSSAAQLSAAVIPHFPNQQDDGTVSLAVNAIPAGAANVAAIHGAVAAAGGGRPAHPVNQVSVVVDPRMNPPAVLQPAEVAPSTGLLQALHGDMSGSQHPQAELASHQVAPGAPIRHINIHMPQEGWMVAETQPSQRNAVGDAIPSQPLPTANTDHPRPSTLSTQNWDTPGPSGILYARPSHPHSPTDSSHLSDDTSSGSGALFSPLGSMVDLPDSDSEYSPHNTPFLNSDSQGTPSMDESSPGSQQRGMSSALQTLADAAVLLSSPQNDSSSNSEENSPISNRPRGRNMEGRNENRGRQLMPREERVVPLVMEDAGHSDDHFPRGGHPLSFPHQQQHVHHHPGSLPPSLAAAEDLPVFVPVIHPTNDAGAHAHVAPVPVSLQSGNTQRMVYPQPERAMNMAVAVIPDVPPLMHVAQGSHAMAPTEHYWSNVTPAPIPIGAPHPVPNPGHQSGTHVVPLVPEQSALHQPTPQGQQAHRQQQQHRLIQALPRNGRQQQQQQASSNFWEDVMPSLDMRLQAMPTSQPNL